MSYRCEVCRQKVPPGRPRMVYTIFRETERGREIFRELPVCAICREQLDAGYTVAQLGKCNPPTVLATMSSRKPRQAESVRELPSDACSFAKLLSLGAPSKKVSL